MIRADEYRRALRGFDERVQAIDGDQWAHPTECCPDWDVRGLVSHVAEETLWAPPLLRGDGPDEVEREVERLFEADVLEVWRIAVDRAESGVTDTALTGVVRLPSDETPASSYVSELFGDTLIHTWDLARAIGVDASLDSDLVEACATWFDQVEDEWRSAGAIGPRVETSPDADPQTLLLARFGRRA